MTSTSRPKSGYRILTFNWHEAYLAMLAGTGHQFDVVQRAKAGLWFWLYTTRPVPENVSLVHPEDALRRLRASHYDLVVCHTPQDVKDIEAFDVPVALVFHNYRETEVALSRAQGCQHISEQAEAMTQILGRVRTVFISGNKKRSWGLDGDVVVPGIDPDIFHGYRGEDLRVLRVGNFLIERDLMLGGSLQQSILKGVPHTTLGLNSSIAGSGLSASFEQLRTAYRDHRVFLHTSRPGAEDGYNLALLEAMCTGMPVVGLNHPGSPVINGESGWLAEDVVDFRHAILSLFGNREEAARMGQRGRDCVSERFPVSRFRESWTRIFDELATPGRKAHRAPRRPTVQPGRAGEGRTGTALGERRRVLLLYTSYPATTARYLERALRRRHLVVTAGPTITPKVWQQWKLEKLGEPARPHDISISADEGLEEIWSRLPPGFDPELVLWVETGLGFFPKDLKHSPVPVFGYLIDTHFDLDWHLEWAPVFDHTFVAQRAYVADFHQKGIAASWLPLACDPEIHRPGNYAQDYDIGFVGSLVDPRRIRLLDALRSRYRTFVDRLFLEEMAQSFSRSRVVWNSAARGDLNMRVFEALAAGSFLLTEGVPGSGQDELFRDGKHLALYDESTLLDRADYFLERPAERAMIARHGRAEVLARHTYDHRVEQILAELHTLESGRETRADSEILALGAAAP